MKKILFLVTQSEYGGAQRYVFETARGLNKTRYSISVAAGEGDGELFKKLQSANIETIQLKEMKRIPWPWQITKALWEISDLLKKEKPDVLFLCSTTAGLLGSVAGQIVRGQTSIIYRIGGWAFQDPRPLFFNWVIFWAEKITARFKDIIIVNSEYDWRIATKRKIISPEKIFKIYNGLDLNSLDFLSRQEARSKLNLNQSAKIVGTVANFYKTKGLQYLIEAAHKMGKTNPQLIFVIIGEGRLRPEIESLIKKYGLKSKVVLAGRIPDAYKYLKAFDIFVLPSLKEGFPWIILEAAAARLPIIATEIGALPEILEKECLVKPKDSKKLAQKISWVLEHPVKAGLKKDFTSQKMVAETEEVLKRITA